MMRVEQALSILRGFNSRLTVVFQSSATNQGSYIPKHMGFVYGWSHSCRFGRAILETARWLVERSGKAFVPF